MSRLDVTSIAVEAGFTLNAGDYQSVKATIAMKADVQRGVDVNEATEELRGLVMSHLLATAAQAHPDAARKLMASGAGQKALAAPETPAETAKRTRRTKEQIAADEAAKAKANGKLADSDPDNKLLADEDSQLGGDELGNVGDEQLGGDDDLLGGEEVVEVTRETLTQKLRDVLKAKGQATLTQLFKKVGASDLKSTPTAKYQELYALAGKALA